MTRVQLARDLGAQGWTPEDLRRLTRSGELERVRRGAYAEPPPAPLDPAAVHRQLIAATLPQLAAGAVLSHTSAALLWGLPVWSDQLARVQVTRDRPGGGQRRRHVQVHGLPLTPAEVTSVGKLPVTSLARTVLDLGCQLSLTRSVGIGDAALRLGLEPDELEELILRGRGRTGIGGARRAAELLDRRAESPEESRSRVLFHQLGVPKPELQFEVFDHDGRFVARCDFGWPEHRTVGECDGKVKYGRLLKPGQDVGDVVYQEKRREDKVRECRYQMVRWGSRDLNRAEDVAAALYRAFARS